MIRSLERGQGLEWQVSALVAGSGGADHLRRPAEFTPSHGEYCDEVNGNAETPTG